MPYPRYAKKKAKVPPIVYVFIAALLLIALLIGMFVNFAIKDAKSDLNTGSLPVDTKTEIEQGSNDSSTSSEPPTSSEAPPSTSSDDALFKEGKVYLDDALFIGDSISMGFYLYGTLKPEQVLANRNVSLDKIHLKKPVYSTPQGELTLEQALDGRSPAKVYILLGSNGIPGLDNTPHIKYYEEMLRTVRDKFPQALIYVQSVTPVTQAVEKKRPNITNTKINEFNLMIKEMAPSYSAHYLDVASVLKDSNGFLSSEFSEADGIHFKRNTYPVMINYYLANIVK